MQSQSNKPLEIPQNDGSSRYGRIKQFAKSMLSGSNSNIDKTEIVTAAGMEDVPNVEAPEQSNTKQSV